MASAAKRTPKRQAQRVPAARQFDQPLSVSRMWKFGGIIGALISGLYVTWTAWTGFGWWVPASVALVDDHITKVVAPISRKVDDQGKSILSGRIETLKASRQLQVDAKSRLELQTLTTKDPIAQQIIAGQKKSVDDTIKSIDDNIADVTAKLLQKTN
jgi:hypothetical protein